MLKRFNDPWDSVPLCCVDTETTGIRVGKDKAVSVALVRFEKGLVVGSFASLVNPGFPIPTEATEIHKITDDAVADAPTVDSVFADARAIALLDGAQLSGFNWRYDREFIPRFGDDRDRWPWLDPFPIIQHVDEFVKGKKRHTLEVSCARHDVELLDAHNAEADARAAGQLLYKVAPRVYHDWSLGDALYWQLTQEANRWHNFMGWLSKQPPREAGAA